MAERRPPTHQDPCTVARSAALAPDSISFSEPIRELFYGHGNRGTYRILFVVLDKAVFVLHIRHGAMLPLKPDDL